MNDASRFVKLISAMLDQESPTGQYLMASSPKTIDEVRALIDSAPNYGPEVWHQGIAPATPGVYQVEWLSGKGLEDTWYSYFDGERWGWMDLSPEKARYQHDARTDARYDVATVQWKEPA